MKNKSDFFAETPLLSACYFSPGIAEGELPDSSKSKSHPVSFLKFRVFTDCFF
jgi:hypothetical protein